MTPLIEVARQIVEQKADCAAHPYNFTKQDVLDFSSRRNAPRLASAFIESQEALEEACRVIRGVIAVADRKTVEFDAARAFLSKHKDNDNG